MGQRPMKQGVRNKAYAIVVVALVGTTAYLGYTAYANHSTISSLKSEITIKDQTITDNDTLLQKQASYIDQMTGKLEEKNNLLEDKNDLLKKDDATITELKADLEKLKAAKREELQTLLKELDTKVYGDSGWKLTFYSLNTESTGKRPGQTGYGYTASGTYVKEGRTIACPPQIKLGTHVIIDGIGERTCEDRGGAIKGKKIDVYLEGKSYRQLMQLGVRRNVNIKIID